MLIIQSIRIYINKIKNRITFKIKSGYYLELLTQETMKLLENAVNKINKDKNGENLPHLGFVELSARLSIIISNIQEYYLVLCQIRHVVVY